MSARINNPSIVMKELQSFSQSNSEVKDPPMNDPRNFFKLQLFYLKVIGFNLVSPGNLRGILEGLYRFFDFACLALLYICGTHFVFSTIDEEDFGFMEVIGPLGSGIYCGTKLINFHVKRARTKELIEKLFEMSKKGE